MRRTLSEEDAAFRDRLRTYFTTEFPRDIRDKVRNGDELTPEEIRRSQRTLAEQGPATPGWPVEWGGQDWTPLQRHIWSSEMAAAGVPAPLAFNANMIGPVLAAFGSQELKERFLEKTRTCEIWWCQGFSEPDAGSDLAGLRTTAVRDGDHYVVNGQKTWTTLGQHADWMFCLVRTDPNAPKKQMGISMLLIDMNTPGITVRPIHVLDGAHEVNEVFFDNMRVPADLLVGEENKGWDYAKFLLGNERVGVAGTGMIKLWLGDLKEHAKSVRYGDGCILDNPSIAARFVELEAAAMALELTAVRVSPASAGGKPNPVSSILKLRGSKLQQEVLELAIDVAGPMATARDALDGIPQWARQTVPQNLNYRKATIYGGSSEVQRSIIAGTILGLKG